MRRFALTLVGTVIGLVALLSFKSQQAPTTGAATPIAATAPETAGAAPGSTSATGSGSTGSGPSSSGTKTVTGRAVDTRWGPVQVQITVRNGKLTSVSAVEYPTENPRDQQINSSAIPVLNQEAIAAGNAKIDMVSGATYTSQGYIGSLQNALDQAGIS